MLQVVWVDRNAESTKVELGPLGHGANVVIPNHEVLSFKLRCEVPLVVMLLKTICKDQ